LYKKKKLKIKKKSNNDISRLQ